MFGQKSQVCHAATPLDADAFRKRMSFNDIGKRVRKSASTERSQHSSPKTTLFFGNGHAFGRKYAILCIFAQPSDIQHITDFRHHSTRQISHCTLQNMPNRTAKHARPRLEALRFARRYMVFRNTNGHLFAKPTLKNTSSALSKRPFRALFHLETRTIFLTKNHNTSPFSYPFLR